MRWEFHPEALEEYRKTTLYLIAIPSPPVAEEKGEYAGDGKSLSLGTLLTKLNYSQRFSGL